MRHILWVGWLLVGGFAHATVESIDELKPVQRAHEEVDQIKKNFRKALQQALAKGGPKDAIGSCKIEAPKLGGKTSESIEVGRTSHKLRNPANAPRDWVKPLLDKWSKLSHAKMPKHELVQLGPNHWGYVEPIFVEAICLGCHGKGITGEVKQAIKMSYPEDQATGFESGDFRGLFWLEMKK